VKIKQEKRWVCIPKRKLLDKQWSMCADRPLPPFDYAILSDCLTTGERYHNTYFHPVTWTNIFRHADTYIHRLHLHACNSIFFFCYLFRKRNFFLFLQTPQTEAYRL